MNTRIVWITGILLLITFGTAKAQDFKTNHPDSINQPYVPADVYKYRRMTEVVQGSGQVFNGRQIQQSAAKDIHQIANQVTGVQYRAGEGVIIRGGVGGTAYFVDGIRVYGALPIITR